MARKRKVLAAFVCIIILFIIVGIALYKKASVASIDSEIPAFLVGDIYSYSPLDKTIEKLEEEGYSAIDIVEETKLASTDTRQQFNYITVDVADYEDLGQRGRLKIYFLNDQLERVSYCPDDIALYLKKLSEKESLDSYVKITESSSCVWLEDKRIVDKRSQWIKRYS
jgi:hypothetical protein